jgi:hypothetical protein
VVFLDASRNRRNEPGNRAAFEVVPLNLVINGAAADVQACATALRLPAGALADARS